MSDKGLVSGKHEELLECNRKNHHLYRVFCRASIFSFEEVWLFLFWAMLLVSGLRKNRVSMAAPPTVQHVMVEEDSGVGPVSCLSGRPCLAKTVRLGWC